MNAPDLSIDGLRQLAMRAACEDATHQAGLLIMTDVRCWRAWYGDEAIYANAVAVAEDSRVRAAARAATLGGTAKRRRRRR